MTSPALLGRDGCRERPELQLKRQCGMFGSVAWVMRTAQINSIPICHSGRALHIASACLNPTRSLLGLLNPTKCPCQHCRLKFSILSLHNLTMSISCDCVRQIDTSTLWRLLPPPKRSFAIWTLPCTIFFTNLQTLRFTT